MATNPEVNIFLNGRDTGASKAVQGVQRSIEALAGTVVAQQALTTFKDQLGQSIDASNKMNNSLIGLASVTAAVGVSQGQAKGFIKDFTADGLVGQTDAVTTLKNLLSSGFSLPEAMQLMDAFKNKAAFNRQSWYEMGGAIVATSEGIKNGNSVLADAAGTTTNLSVMAKQAGVSIDEMGSITQSAALRQAYLAGFTNDAASAMGDAAKLAGEFSGDQSRLNNVLFSSQARLGDLAKVGIGPLLHQGVEWLENNQQIAVSLAAAAGVVVAFGGTLLGLATVARFVSLVMGGPLMIALTLLSAVVGVVAFGAFNKLQDQMLSTNQTTEDGADEQKRLAGAHQQASKEAQKQAEQLRDLAESVVKANRDYQQSLAGIVKTHEEKIADLKKQAEDERSTFAKAQDEKVDSFKRSQDEMALRHSDQISQIQRDLDEEALKGRFADQGRVRDLQDRLMRETAEYERSTAEKLSEYEKDTANAQDTHSAKLTDLQVKLNEELAFMQKHSSDLAGIRASDAMDEIEKLRQSHTDQMVEFDKQKARIIDNAGQTTAASIAAQNAEADAASTQSFSSLGTRMGTDMAQALKDAFTKDLWNKWETWASNTTGPWINDVSKWVGEKTGAAGAGKMFGSFMHNLGVPGFAMGTSFAPGGLALVGERGPELVNLPRGSSVTPAHETSQALSGRTVNQTNNYYITKQIDMDAAIRHQMMELRLA